MPADTPNDALAVAAEQISLGWARFLQNVEMARHYDEPYLLELMRKMPNPILDAMLPTLLFVQLMALLDDGLELYRTSKDIEFKPRTNQDLYHRIELLKNALSAPSELHTLRQKRNDLAHPPAAFADWAELGAAIEVVDVELTRLGLIEGRPEYKFFSARSGARNSSDPKYLFEFEYKYGLKQHGDVVLSVSWIDRIASAKQSSTSNTDA